MESKGSYIEFVKIQKIRIPLNKEITTQKFINFVNGDENIYDYDGDIFDFDNEEVVEEEHSYMNNDCKLVLNGKIRYEFKTPYQGFNLLKLNGHEKN